MDELIQYCEADGRVCPLPPRWDALWKLLPGRHRNATGGWEPELPLILAAWAHSSVAEKRARLREHIRWAAETGALDTAEEFLRGLPEEQWLHVGEYPA